MYQIYEYFAHIPSSHRSAILLGGITLFMLLETGIPLFRWQYPRWKHLGINLFFTFTTVIVNFALAGIMMYGCNWAQENNFGILNWLPEMPLWLYMIVGLLLLDLIGAYFIHWLEHKVKWMWRFHLVHHTDPNVDTSTANRHHPGESIFRFVFTALGAMIAGAPIALVFMYQSFSVALSQFNHANITVPKWLENSLGFVFITPSMHRVHHHYRLPYTDRNFGNIFSFWDRLFGTYITLENEKIVFGVDTHMDQAEQTNIGTMLQIPFQEYRQPTGRE